MFIFSCLAQLSNINIFVMGITTMSLCLLIVVVSIQGVRLSYLQQDDSNKEQVNYDGYKVLRVVPQHYRQLRKLESLELSMEGIDFWKGPSMLGHNVDIMIAPKSEVELKQNLRSINLPYETIIEDVGLKIRTNMEQPTKAPHDSRAGMQESDSESDSCDEFESNDFFKAYQPYDKIVRRLSRLALRYDDLIEMNEIGRTFEKQPMYLIKMRSNERTNKSIILIDGGHHAREWISHSVVVYFIDKIANMRGKNADVEYLLKHYELWFVPVVNPDGYQFSFRHNRMWRKNRSYRGNAPRSQCYGVDLNRNYPIHWGEKGSSRNRCSDIYAGPWAESEREVQAMARLLSRNQCRILVHLSLHSYGQYILTPFGWTHEEPLEYGEYARVIARANRKMTTSRKHSYTYGPTSTTIYLASGGATDYAYSVFVDYPFTMELPDKGMYGFLMPPQQIVKIGEETFGGIVEMAKAITDKSHETRYTLIPDLATPDKLRRLKIRRQLKQKACYQPQQYNQLARKRSWSLIN